MHFLYWNLLGSTKYSDKDSGGMLVWSPYHTIVDSKCKYCATFFCHFHFSIVKIGLGDKMVFINGIPLSIMIEKMFDVDCI